MSDINEPSIIPEDWIEVLSGVYFKPSLEWYKQDPSLIDLALQIEQTPPVDYEIEDDSSDPPHMRLKWAIWESTTEMGLFRMRIDKNYVYGIGNNEFNAIEKQNKVTIIKIE